MKISSCWLTVFLLISTANATDSSRSFPEGKASCSQTAFIKYGCNPVFRNSTCQLNILKCSYLSNSCKPHKDGKCNGEGWDDNNTLNVCKKRSGEAPGNQYEIDQSYFHCHELERDLKAAGCKFTSKVECDPQLGFVKCNFESTNCIPPGPKNEQSFYPCEKGYRLIGKTICILEKDAPAAGKVIDNGGAPAAVPEGKRQ